MSKYEQSKEFFDGYIEEYADSIMAIQPQFYKNSAERIETALKKSGAKTVLDIGNGGVINYDYSGLNKLDCADLSLSDKAIEKYKNEEKISFFQADIMNLVDIADDKYDAVIVQTVIHHLAGENFKITKQNVKSALSECLRVLKPGGSLLIVESTVTRPFETVERLLYKPMQLYFKIKKFGAVYQFSNASLRKYIESLNYKITDTSPVKLDKYVWVMTKKVLTKLTPCCAVWIEIIKDNAD